ncbi:MAG: tripartite tricarboxylate transporter permease [Nanoarchaeota archaeon]
MFLEILVAVLLGTVCGTISGITPGIHLNLVALLVVSASTIIKLHPLVTGSFIIAMAITHTFLDAIPGIYLGAPDADKALSVLPGHRMLLQGKGHAALLLTIFGSFASLLLSVVLFPVFIVLMKLIDESIAPYIGMLLIFISWFMVLREPSWKKRLLSMFLFLAAGSIGIIVLSLPMRQPLFPLLSGLFGTSLLLLSLSQKSTLPKQERCSAAPVKGKIAAKAIAGATIVGFIAAFLPGFGSAQAAILAQQTLGNIGDEGFLVLVGGINTANMMISVATAYGIDKARNGAIVAMQEILDKIDFRAMLIFVAASLMAAGIATLLSIRMSRIFMSLITRVSTTKLSIGIICFIVLLAFIFDGLLGLLVLLACTSVGLAAGLLGSAKNHLMGCLLLPVILFFML